MKRRRNGLGATTAIKRKIVIIIEKDVHIHTVEPPVSDHPKCKGLVVAYESRTAKAKFLSQTRIEWYTYSKKIMNVYFPLPITGSFIDKIVRYSM